MTAITINRYVPSQLESKLYTENRVCRILKIKKADIEFVYPCENGCLVGFWTHTKFIPKSEFTALLVGDRKNRSKSLTVTPNAFDSTDYTVRNEDKGTIYRVETYQGYMNCTCRDYENLSNDFNTPKVSCKHIYAVLNNLGYASLKDYIASETVRYQPPEYGLTEMAQGHY